MINQPSIIEVSNYRFLVMDAPNRQNSLEYVDMLKQFNVVHLVRTCEPMYDDVHFLDNGIQTHALYFSDGAAPPKAIVRDWLYLVKSTFQHPKQDESRPCIAVHCMAGLGRAPVLVAIALIEAGLDYLSVVELIRKRRKGALNEYQLNYLKGYNSTHALDDKVACCSLL